MRNKEMLMDPLECSLALGMVTAETRGRVAAQQASGSLPWIGVDDPSDVQRLQAEHAVSFQGTANFKMGGSEKLTGSPTTRGTCYRRTEAWRTCGTWTTPLEVSHTPTSLSNTIRRSVTWERACVRGLHLRAKSRKTCTLHGFCRIICSDGPPVNLTIKHLG